MTLMLLALCLEHNCPLVEDLDNGEVRSPNWPYAFPNNSSCTFRIKTSTQRRLLLFFNDLSFPVHADCSRVRLTIHYNGREVCVCVCGCVCWCVCWYARVCARVCTWVCVWVHACDNLIYKYFVIY